MERAKGYLKSAMAGCLTLPLLLISGVFVGGHNTVELIRKLYFEGRNIPYTKIDMSGGLIAYDRTDRPLSSETV